MAVTVIQNMLNKDIIPLHTRKYYSACWMQALLLMDAGSALALPLFVLGVWADNNHLALAANNLTFFAHRFN
jgi:hypothetical protein